MNEKEVKGGEIVSVDLEKTKTLGLFENGGILKVDGLKVGKQVFKWYYDSIFFPGWFADTHQITFEVTDLEDYAIIPPAGEQSKGWFSNIFVNDGLYRNSDEYRFFDEAFGLLDNANRSAIFNTSPGWQNAFRRLSRKSSNGIKTNIT